MSWKEERVIIIEAEIDHPEIDHQCPFYDCCSRRGAPGDCRLQPPDQDHRHPWFSHSNLPRCQRAAEKSLGDNIREPSFRDGVLPHLDGREPTLVQEPKEPDWTEICARLEQTPAPQEKPATVTLEQLRQQGVPLHSERNASDGTLAGFSLQPDNEGGEVFIDGSELSLSDDGQPAFPFHLLPEGIQQRLTANLRSTDEPASDKDIFDL